MNYKQKYLKYKLKYLNLKKKMSGGSFEISKDDYDFVQQQIDTAEEYNKLDDNVLATILMNRTNGNIEDIESELAKYRESIPKLVEIGGITEEVGTNLIRKITSVEKILIVDPLIKDATKKEDEREKKEEEYRKQKKEFEEKYGTNFEESIISAPIHIAAATIQSMLLGNQDRRKAAKTKNKAAATIQSMLKGKQDRREAAKTKNKAATTIQSILMGKKGRKEAAEENKRYTEGPYLSSFRRRQKAKYNKEKAKYDKKKPDESDDPDCSDNSSWSD